MAWDLNGFIHPDIMIHVEKVGQDKEFYHIVTKNKRRVSVPRKAFMTLNSELLKVLYHNINRSIYIQSLHNVVEFKKGNK